MSQSSARKARDHHLDGSPPNLRASAASLNPPPSRLTTSRMGPSRGQTQIVNLGTRLEYHPLLTSILDPVQVGDGQPRPRPSTINAVPRPKQESLSFRDASKHRQAPGPTPPLPNHMSASHGGTGSKVSRDTPDQGHGSSFDATPRKPKSVSESSREPSTSDLTGGQSNRVNYQQPSDKYTPVLRNQSNSWSSEQQVHLNPRFGTSASAVSWRPPVHSTTSSIGRSHHQDGSRTNLDSAKPPMLQTLIQEVQRPQQAAQRCRVTNSTTRRLTHLRSLLSVKDIVPSTITGAGSASHLQGHEESTTGSVNKIMEVVDLTKNTEDNTSPTVSAVMVNASRCIPNNAAVSDNDQMNVDIDDNVSDYSVDPHTEISTTLTLTTEGRILTIESAPSSSTSTNTGVAKTSLLVVKLRRLSKSHGVRVTYDLAKRNLASFFSSRSNPDERNLNYCKMSEFYMKAAISLLGATTAFESIMRVNDLRGVVNLVEVVPTITEVCTTIREVMLQEKFDFNPSEDYPAKLFNTAILDSVDYMKRWIQSDKEVDLTPGSEPFVSVVKGAIQYGSFNVLRFLANMDGTNPQRFGAALSACVGNNGIRALNVLLEYPEFRNWMFVRVDANRPATVPEWPREEPRSIGTCALHEACVRGKAELVSFMIEAKIADVAILDGFAFTLATRLPDETTRNRMCQMLLDPRRL
ncbi:hypothetical protein HDU76_004594 [Blyttiomyces sp. JEL0837]|nr:hypothetical protein HDU76_004594 [Blyttiomyces sp. JEL0837]